MFKRQNIVEEQELEAAVEVLNRARASTPPGADGAGLRSARTEQAKTAENAAPNKRPAAAAAVGHDSVTVDGK